MFGRICVLFLFSVYGWTIKYQTSLSLGFDNDILVNSDKWYRNFFKYFSGSCN